jgi:diguanylate cyclase (GGDEF)-like protein
MVRPAQPERRAQPAVAPATGQRVRMPDWHEQLTQFATRYVFCLLGLAFFNGQDHFRPLWLSLSGLNLLYLAYFVANTAFLLHARTHRYSLVRFRIAMWVDLFLVSVSVLHDPYPIPPSLLAFIMVVLGNGMRYGLRLFAEGLVLALTCTATVLLLRQIEANASFSPGVAFLALFGAIILVYAYFLMERIDGAYRRLEHDNHEDALTGALNRRGLTAVAPGLLGGAKDAGRTGVMCLDMEHYREVSAHQGHPAGDWLLAQFGRMLRENLRPGDVVARVEGEAFVCLLPGASAAQSASAAERVRNAFRDWARSHQMPATVAVGVGEAPRDGNTLEQILAMLEHEMCAGRQARQDAPAR